MGYSEYEMVIGLEVHVELDTETKIFCGCRTTFGKTPNTQVCPICLGFPGALPVLNEKVVEKALLAGLATGCKIARTNKQDRKHYFYPDLPKAYQISQYDLPICYDGAVHIETPQGHRTIGITRIHIEEDAGKLTHDSLLGGTLVDYNRGGVPLIEVVSEPEIRSAEEAKAYLKKLRAAFIYAGVSPCKMNEGQFRADVNLSVRKKDDPKLGTRTEMKNLNSFTFVGRAIEAEFKRQVDSLERGEVIIQQTRRWVPERSLSEAMRNKEDAHDYRYFPEPDLPPLRIKEELLVKLKDQMPALPEERKVHYMKAYGLKASEAEVLVSDQQLADLFEAAAGSLADVRPLANLLLSEVLRLLGEGEDIPLQAEQLSELAGLISEEKISFSMAKRVLGALWEEPHLSAAAYVEEQGLQQLASVEELLPIIESVLARETDSVSDYLGGKDKALMALMGRVMRETRGRAHPERTRELLVKQLETLK